MAYYIAVDELPEGTEASDVVTRADYDALQAIVIELEGTRDELAQALNAQTVKARDAAAKYAALVLDNAGKSPDNDGAGASKPKGRTIEGIFN